MEAIEFILVANSPGELSSLVKPILETIREHSAKKHPIKTTLFLTPCQFSSGREIDFVKTLEVDNVVTSDDYRKWILGIPTKKELKFKYKGIVLYLGGDLMHAVLIAKKLGYRAYAYLHGQKAGWKSVFSRFFVVDEKAEKKMVRAHFKKDKVKVVGDLMINSVKALPKEEVIKTWKLSEEKPIVALLPGSRGWEVDYMLPFYESMAAELKKIIPGIQFLLIVSPFMPLKEIEAKSKENVFDIMGPLNLISAANLAVTIPGTNTAQIAALGVPSLMLFPLNKLDDIPLEGLLYYITKLPFIGGSIKKIAAEIINRNTKFFALPNMKAHKMIMPEMRGDIKPEQAVEKVLEMLNHPEKLKQMGTELKKAMGESDAAETIIGEILNETFSAAG